MLDSRSVVAIGSVVRTADPLGQLQALNTSYLGRRSMIAHGSKGRQARHYGASVGCSTAVESQTVGMRPLAHCQGRLDHESITADSEMPSSHLYFPRHYWTEQKPRRQYGREYG